jgi:ketosteroid isomerase-like protein
MSSISCRCTYTLLLISIIAILSSACGVTMHPEKMSDDSAAVEQITRLEHQFAEAALRGDYASIEGLLAPEFIGVDPSGRELSRSQVLAEQQSPDRRIEILRHDNIRVHMFEDCAVVFAVTVMRGKYQGQAFGGKFPYMRVWIKRQGRWLAVATQSSNGMSDKGEK